MTERQFKDFMTILDTILLAIKATNILIGLVAGMLFTILIRLEVIL